MPLAQAWEVVVTREPEFTDDDRHRLLGLGRFRAGVCEGCGYHHALARDPGLYFTPDDDVCPVCEGRDRYERIREADEKPANDPAPSQPRPSDGRTTFMRLLTPDEAARLTKGGESVGHTP